MKNQKTYEYDGKTFNSIRELALYSGVNYNKLCTRLRTSENTDIDAAIAFVRKQMCLPDGRTLNKVRTPLYVTPDGREIWTYDALAKYFHISNERMHNLRITQRLNINQIIDLITKEKEKDVIRNESLEKAIRVQITVDLAELVIADIEKRISVKGESSIIASVDRPYDPKYVCNDSPKLEMEVNDMVIKNLNNRNDGYKYYFASHIAYIREHRWYSVIYFATKVMEDK